MLRAVSMTQAGTPQYPRSMKPVRVSHWRFGAEVKMTDASNSGVHVASVDATDAS
jgi:hypothetical protein